MPHLLTRPVQSKIYTRGKVQDDDLVAEVAPYYVVTEFNPRHINSSCREPSHSTVRSELVSNLVGTLTPQVRQRFRMRYQPRARLYWPISPVSEIDAPRGLCGGLVRTAAATCAPLGAWRCRYICMLVRNPSATSVVRKVAPSSAVIPRYVTIARPFEC